MALLTSPDMWSSWRRRCWRVVTLLVLSAVAAVSARAEPAPTEYQVKAAFLYNFTKFVEWPARRVQPAEFMVCIFGEDPFGDDFEAVVEKKTVSGRKLVVSRTRRVADLAQCHIAFVSASERDRWPEILDAARRGSILTVSDTEPFAREGGMINLVTSNNRIRLEINASAARQSGLKISSKLLKLATVVSP